MSSPSSIPKTPDPTISQDWTGYWIMQACREYYLPPRTTFTANEIQTDRRIFNVLLSGMAGYFRWCWDNDLGNLYVNYFHTSDDFINFADEWIRETAVGCSYDCDEVIEFNTHPDGLV